MTEKEPKNRPLGLFEMSRYIIIKIIGVLTYVILVTLAFAIGLILLAIYI